MNPLNNVAKSLPAAPEAEQALLSCALQDERTLWPSVQLGVCSTWFHTHAYGVIWQALTDLAAENAPIELASLSQRLTATGQLSHAGGVGTLAEIYNLSVSPTHWSFYAGQLREKFQRRGVISTAAAIVTAGMDGEQSTEELLAEAEERLASLQSRQLQTAEVCDGKKFIMDAVEHIQHVAKNPDTLDGLATGFTGLDSFTRGLRPGELIIIGARPGIGKTALGCCILENVVLGVGHYQEHAAEKGRALIVSCEMSGKQLLERMVCSRAGISMRAIRENGLNKGEHGKIMKTAKELHTAPLHVLEGRGLSVQALRAKLRRTHRETPLGLIVVDYIALLSSATKSSKAAREREVAEVAIELKSAALELGVPVIALAQLNRDIDQRTGAGKPSSKPKLSDLRESGQIEAEADLVAMIHRPSAGGAGAPPDFQPHTPAGIHTEAEKQAYRQQAWKELAFLIVQKNRHGETGEIPLRWKGELTRFESVTNSLRSNN